MLANIFHQIREEAHLILRRSEEVKLVYHLTLKPRLHRIRARDQIIPFDLVYLAS